MVIELRRVLPPHTGALGPTPAIPDEEFEARARSLYGAANVDWVIVYGDREHSANIAFLSGYDPRFEEALLILGPNDTRVLVVGNEGVLYAKLASLPAEVALCQSFSLLGQPRDRAPRLVDVLGDVGIRAGSQVGVVGWKYLEAAESDEPTEPSFVPSFVVGALRRLGADRVVDSSAVMMNPVDGVRTQNSAAQIAAFEWAAVRASTGVLRVVNGTRPGMTEFEAAGTLGYQGDPLSCHVMFASGKDEIVGLRSPSGRRIGQGDGASTAVGYWGSLCCRAGLVTKEPDREFLSEVVQPYYAAICAWYAEMRVGATGDDVHQAVMTILDGASWQPLLNPGHQISLDEWLHTPIAPGSDQTIASGMLFQCDIIPSPLPAGYALNCEDTIAVADQGLRAEIADDYPDVWRRITKRQSFMREELGLEITDDVLPLSASPAYLAPFWLDDSLVCTVSG